MEFITVVSTAYQQRTTPPPDLPSPASRSHSLHSPTTPLTQHSATTLPSSFLSLANNASDSATTLPSSFLLSPRPFPPVSSFVLINPRRLHLVSRSWTMGKT